LSVAGGISPGFVLSGLSGLPGLSAFTAALALALLVLLARGLSLLFVLLLLRIAVGGVTHNFLLGQRTPVTHGEQTPRNGDCSYSSAVYLWLS
jgi:hypothetical protein